MKRINVLDINTSNKIAAGEVVERPFSVVKELVENSLDAQAKNITIEIVEGGQKSIKITDDGDGIHPEDIEKAFLPHATSKIQYIDDIYKVNTFGFRGEALASIAAVSEVNIKSRTAEFDYGKELTISGGKVNYIKDVGINIGTCIEVKDLFFNVPARLKFLKSPQRETALINDIVERLALINPSVSFKLFNNNNKVLSTFASSNLTDTIRTIYGKNIQENIMYFENHSDMASVYGYIGNAEISKGSRNNQSIYVNKRYIKNKLITTAVENAFKSFLTINRFPFFILFLDIFPEFIDVNVHPTKSEIKFKDDRFIFKLVFDAVHEAIRRNLRNSFDIPSEDIFEMKPTEEFDSKTLVQIPLDLKENYVFNNKLFKDNNSLQDVAYTKIENNNYLKESSADFLVENSIIQTEMNNSTKINLEYKEAKFPELNVIGQFNATYILAQYGEELYILDQHAAHEKILFEKYIEEVKNGQVIAQVLAAPEVIELSTENFIVYSENIEIFKTTGFNIEIFGKNTISIREVPIILGEISIRSLFLDIIDNIKIMGTGEATEVKYDKIAKLACKSAVKANDKLSILEMKSLVNKLRFINNPFTCPHGRPTIIKITLNEIEKRFKRI
ncbi:DNA mismatch repair endonuclease MutL [Clostridium sp. SYSU_GA19001]|uniref:DNA mismatch repair endonuclease MutL n=1 Tax=Clostridium caldaquaticum TaxID=2940653 RepID=UPI002076F494|nr:DNA mismatch repair endonuclease MutL [Clostridium caldaquaticum]MCM8710656.1 DNA mismatch repair endonuclease MutL [Clostridium caldaquaticum]